METPAKREHLCRGRQEEVTKIVHCGEIRNVKVESSRSRLWRRAVVEHYYSAGDLMKETRGRTPSS